LVGNTAGAAIGGIGGCIVGGLGGYWAGSEVAGVVYDWADDTSFSPLMRVTENEVHLWLRERGF
jgi:hypothetical protein